MRDLLGQLGKDAIIINADPSPRIFSFIHRHCEVRILGDSSAVPSDVEDRALIILDVNDTGNIGNLSTLVLPRVREHFILDHHEHDGVRRSKTFIAADASSTCELVYDLLGELDGAISFETATALYAGIVFDTGSFIYPKTSSRTFEIARRLVQIGVVPNEVYSRMYESNSVSALLLQAKVLATLELHHANHVAVQKMLLSTIEEAGATYEEGQALINTPLRSESVKVSIFFKQNEEGILRCSLRSKGDIDVAQIAQANGGGGHKTAAGFKCRDSVEETQAMLLEKLRPYFV